MKTMVIKSTFPSALGSLIFVFLLGIPTSAMDLYPVVSSGWSYANVARNLGNSTSDYCPLTPVLYGWSEGGDTFLNGTAEFVGWLWDSTGTFYTYVYLDDVHFGTVTNSSMTGLVFAIQYYWVNWSRIVPGGRHHFRTYQDATYVVSEDNESNNGYSTQFVWYPYEILSMTTYTISPGASGGSYGGYRNMDGFRFDPIGYWVAVAVRQASPEDYDMALFNDYASSLTGFTSTIETSMAGVGTVDFITIDGNYAASGAFQTGVYDYSGSGAAVPYGIQVDNSSGDSCNYSGGDVLYGPYTFGSASIIRCHESYISPTGTLWITLENQTPGNLDLHFFSSVSGDYYLSRSYATGTRYAGGDGQIEQVQVTINNSGYYGITVTNENSTSGTYYIRISPNRYTPTPTATATRTPTRTATRTFTLTPSPTRTPTLTPTFTRTPTQTPTLSPTLTPTLSPTRTPTNTPTRSPTSTPTNTPTLSPTDSPTLTPTRTTSPSPTETPTRSPTTSATYTETATPSPFPTDTRTPTLTSTVSPTPTPTALIYTPTPTATATMAPIPTMHPGGIMILLLTFLWFFIGYRQRAK